MACDISGNPFPHGGERIDATLSLLGSQDPSVIATVIDNKDGTYVTSFIPQRIGEHKLSITIDGNHIKESPFSMYVREERKYESLSTMQQCFGLSGFPYDVAVEDNEVYVAMLCGNNYGGIEVFNQNQQRVRSIGYLEYAQPPYSATVHSGLEESAENIQFYSPMAIAIQGDVLYVVESGNCCVQ